MNDFLRLLELPVFKERSELATFKTGLEKFAYPAPKFFIRGIVEKDAARLFEIEKASFPDEPYPEDVFKYWHVKGAGLVAADVATNVPHGYLLHRQDSENPEFQYGKSLAVHPEHRKEGMAEALMCNLLEKYANVSADVDTKNEASKSLLKKLGFKAVRTFKANNKRSHRMHRATVEKDANSKSAFENYEPFLQLVKRAEDDNSHPFTVAVDLDGTLAKKEEPFSADSIGVPIEKAVAWVKKFKKAGARIIIFTVRGDNELTKDWLDEHEVPYDFINENPDQPKGSSGKVFADVYWDDKAYNAENPEEHGPTILQKITASKDTEPQGFSVSIMKQTIVTISAPMLLEALQPEEDK